MAIPVIPAGTPTVITPDPTPQTYDHYWLRRVFIQAEDPNQPVRAVAALHKARTMPDGSTQLSPVDQDVRITIPDLFQAAATMTAAGDSSLSDAITAVLNGIIAYAKAQNVAL